MVKACCKKLRMSYYNFLNRQLRGLFYFICPNYLNWYFPSFLIQSILHSFIIVTMLITHGAIPFELSKLRIMKSCSIDIH